MESIYLGFEAWMSRQLLDWFGRCLTFRQPLTVNSSAGVCMRHRQQIIMSAMIQEKFKKTPQFWETKSGVARDRNQS